MLKPTLTLLVLSSFVLAEPLAESKELFAQGKFKEAYGKAGAVSEEDAGYAKACYLRGEIALLLGDAKGATANFRAARGKKPGSAPILVGLGRALLEQGEHAEAVKVLGEAVKKAPASGRAQCFYGIALKQDTFGKRGAKQIMKGVKLAPDDALVARAAVLYWLDEGEPAKANKAARAFAKKNRKHPMGPFLAALVLEREKKYKDAIDAYRKAVELDGKFLDAHKNLAILCIAQNPMYRDKERTDLAMKHLARYRELGGKDPKILQVEATLKKFLPQITGGR
jgi:tetratricopeptide (TPR) repeat protein